MRRSGPASPRPWRRRRDSSDPPQQATRWRQPLEVEAAKRLRPLQPLAHADPAEPSGDGGSALHRPREAEAVVERLEVVAELELVALCAAEELDPGDALGSSRLDCVERVDLPRREPRERGVERDPVHEHPALEREVVVEGDRPPVDPHQHDPRNAEWGERADQCMVEAPAGGPREPPTVGPSLPAELVKREGVFERGVELVPRPRDLNLDAAELRELPAAAPVVVALLRGELRPVDGLP